MLLHCQISRGSACKKQASYRTTDNPRGVINSKYLETQKYLALVSATLTLWLLERKPIDLFALERTAEIIIKSFSPPWKPSTDRTSTKKSLSSSVLYLVPRFSLIAAIWALYGDIIPILILSPEAMNPVTGKKKIRKPVIELIYCASSLDNAIKSNLLYLRRGWQLPHKLQLPLPCSGCYAHQQLLHFHMLHW